jgi:hypothetical protein
MTEPIEIPIEVTDADESAAAIRALAGAVVQLSSKLDTLGQKQEQVKTEAEKMAEAAEKAADAEQRTATQAIALGQRLQGAAMAVQSLTTQFGGQSRTAGLIGASIATSVQFAQLGLMLGPSGALVGGIVGAAIPALAALREEMEVSESTIDATAHSVAELTAAYEAAGEAAALQARLANGTATLAERTDVATQAQARYNDEAQRHHTLLLQTLDDAQRELASRSAVFDQLDVGYHTQSLAAQQAVDDARAELEANEAKIETLRKEAEARTAVAAQMEREAAAHEMIRREQQQGNEHNSERARIRRQEARRAAAPSRTERETEQSGFETSWAATLADGEAEAAQRRMDALDAEYEANEHLVEAKLRWQQELDEADKAALEAQREHDAARLEMIGRQHDREIEARAAHTQRISEEAEAVASSLIGSMTQVIGQIAEGEATAEEGAKLMFAAFLQAMSQRAEIEALAEVARAVSDGASGNYLGMAGHIAGALAWGAVAVATGVGGAAISNDVGEAQAARREAEKPASPRGDNGGGKGGPSNTTINFNGPVMTAQTEATFGRMIIRAGDRARQRFPGT